MRGSTNSFLDSKIREQPTGTFIILADSNAIADPGLDSLSGLANQQINNLYSFLIARHFEDSFRSLHPLTKAYSRIGTSNQGKTGSRIDHIYFRTTEHLGATMIGASIDQRKIFSHTDHCPVTCDLTAPLLTDSIKQTLAQLPPAPKWSKVVIAGMEITQALEKELQPPIEAVSIINQITLSANNQEHTTLLKEMETELQAEKQRTNNWYNPDQLTRELLDKIAVQFHSMIRRVGSIPELISAKDLSS